MKKIILTSTALLFTVLSHQAIARDDHNLYSIEEALNTPAAKEKINPNIKLYFATQSSPKVAKELGEWKTNKKTNAFNKSDKEACQWTFLSAILELQERATKEGGDAVVGIVSNYKDVEHSSTTEYMCGNGALMSGVAFKAKVVKLK
ncbi:hypothetical protein Meth11DRAFT_2416 [Methylophilaceae bacterium 11]|jgi:hypothetical protein|uniref:hypothetical protein n=1 Tax=unclassified Methylotenera TaxID=2643294 RepID=UPI0003748D28|nr:MULTISPECIES: hypothetical protein [unclassified Methylotenera]EUJ11571.1 hypothetical protein Meth11DRAFT_2416 [Methylophilaceae bacterium 11]